MAAFVRIILPDSLDPHERKILRMLQEDTTLSTAAIADAVGLSPSPCWRRIDRLDRDGFIKRRVAIVERKKVGLHTQVFALIKLNAQGRANLDEFSASIRHFPEVLECHVLMGSVDFMLRIVTADIESYERFFSKSFPGSRGCRKSTPPCRSPRSRAQPRYRSDPCVRGARILQFDNMEILASLWGLRRSRVSQWQQIRSAETRP